MKSATEWIDECEFVHILYYTDCPFCERNNLKSKVSRLTAAASNLLKKHSLGAVSEADVRWMETELENAK